MVRRFAVQRRLDVCCNPGKLLSFDFPDFVDFAVAFMPIDGGDDYRMLVFPNRRSYFVGFMAGKPGTLLGEEYTCQYILPPGNALLNLKDGIQRTGVTRKTFQRLMKALQQDFRDHFLRFGMPVYY